MVSVFSALLKHYWLYYLFIVRLRDNSSKKPCPIKRNNRTSKNWEDDRKKFESCRLGSIIKSYGNFLIRNERLVWNRDSIVYIKVRSIIWNDCRYRYLIIPANSDKCHRCAQLIASVVRIIKWNNGRWFRGCVLSVKQTSESCAITGQIYWK